MKTRTSNVEHIASEAPPPSPTRRTVLKGGAVAAAAAGLAGAIGARPQRAQPGSSPALAGTKPSKQQFLLDRLTFGRTPEMVNEYRARGYTGFLDWQLDYENIDDSAAVAAVAAENPDVAKLWGYDSVDIVWDPAWNTFPGLPVQALSVQALILYGHHSRRQLQWVMTDFMQNVHNTFLGQPWQYLFWLPFVRDVIHAGALGKYPDLVRASGQGGSMLWYLQQYLSDADNPIENYARELMELHTVSPYSVFGLGTFDEQDVYEAARILTGWSLDLDPGGLIGGPNPQFGKFFFDPAKHNTDDPKTIGFLGPQDYPDYSSHGAGLGEGLDLIEDLSLYPLTALHISYRLIRWFLGDDVFGQFYQPWLRTAQAYYGSGGDMKIAIRELFDEAHFDEIAPVPMNKIRRPLDLVVGVKRATAATLTLTEHSWLLQLDKMGQIPGMHPPPDGYPPENVAWTGSMQPRVEFLYDTLFTGNGLDIPQSQLDLIFPVGLPTSVYAKTANEFVFGGGLTRAEVAAVQTYLDNLPSGTDFKRSALFGIFAAPSYQYLY